MPHAHTPVKDEIARLLDIFEDDLQFDAEQHSDDDPDVQAEIAEQLALLRKHRSLIAAAPELLEACREALEPIKASHFDMVEAGEMVAAELLLEVRHKIEAAITRATKGG